MADLLYNIEEVKDYAKRILMKLEDDEVYILLLNTRKKYCPVELSKSEEVIGRELISYNDLDKIIRKIKKITRIEGIYADSHTLEDIPIHCFALYCLIDPRSTLKGYGEFISNINKWIYENFKGESNLELYRRIDSKLFSAIHRSRSRSLYRVIDIDKKDDNILDNNIGE